VFRFFGGKGGVGKTTCAAAAALAAADAGHRVLLVSTDPAHSLSDALGRRIGARPVALPARRPAARGRAGSLVAVELDADRALTRWIAARRPRLHRIVAHGTYLDAQDIDRFLRLSLPGVDELIGLVELSRLAGARPYDEVVVDTAPTGHTLRLLAMPATLGQVATVLDDMQAKHRFLAESLGGRYRADASDALIEEIARTGATLQTQLRDPAISSFTWVLLPEPLAIAEARDALRALDGAGIAVGAIVVNRLTPAPPGRCDLCEGRRATEAAALAGADDLLRGRTVRALPALPREPRGPGALRHVARSLHRAPALPRARRQPGGDGERGPLTTMPDAPVAGVAFPLGAGAPQRWQAGTGHPDPSHPPAPDAGPGVRWLLHAVPEGARVVMLGGKGGVGKTTCAAAVALALGARAPTRRILLLSTDPAHSLGDVLGVALDDTPRSVPGAPPALAARELDAPALFQDLRRRYRAGVEELFAVLTGGSRFDLAYDRAVVQDLLDLAPPGLDELLGILTVIEALEPRTGAAGYETVVVDTAPTGHALRLLRMPAAALQWVHALLAVLLKYRRVVGLGDLGAQLVEVAGDLRRLQEVLRDPDRTAVIAVTRAATLPRLETARLLRALRRLGIPQRGLIVNAVTAGAGTRCSRCRATMTREARVIGALARDWRSLGGEARAMILTPGVMPPPAGVRQLTAWPRTWHGPH
jgi:arsenite-transporting ATPase